MRNVFALKALILATSLSLTVFAYPPAWAQGTTFTYQGRLDDGGTPANGLHDLRFRLFDAASGGVQIGSTVCVDNVSVTDGIFTAQIDFGQQFATTAQRHLEIEVRSDTGLLCGDSTGFVLLSPRQQLTAAPMASHANSAFTLDAADGSPASAVYVDAIGNVGIGTLAPTARLDVRGGAMLVESLGDQADLLWLSSERSWVFRQQGTGAAAALKLESVGGGGNKNFVVQTTGFMGVGTTSPAAKLDVRGDVKLGAAGEYFAPGGAENLRIIRGKVSAAGGVLLGSGFTASRSSTGVYFVTFSPAYPIGQAPILTASAESSGSARFAMVNTPTHVATAIRIVNGSGTAVDADFYFIAIGPR